MDLHKKLIEFGYSQDEYQELIDSAYKTVVTEASSNDNRGHLITLPLRHPEKKYANASLGYCDTLCISLLFRTIYMDSIGANIWKLVDYNIFSKRESSKSLKNYSGSSLKAAVLNAT